MRLAFVMCSETERLVLRHLNADIALLRDDQVHHVEHLLSSWRVPQGMLWEPAIKCVRKAIRRTRRDRP